MFNSDIKNSNHGYQVAWLWSYSDFTQYNYNIPVEKWKPTTRSTGDMTEQVICRSY